MRTTRRDLEIPTELCLKIMTIITTKKKERKKKEKKKEKRNENKRGDVEKARTRNRLAAELLGKVGSWQSFDDRSVILEVCYQRPRHGYSERYALKLQQLREHVKIGAC